MTLPVAVADAFSTIEGLPLDVAAPGVLANDGDVDGDELTAMLTDGVDHGSLTLNPDGSLYYQPEPGYIGPDSFSYKALAHKPVVLPIDTANSQVRVDATVRAQGQTLRSNDTSRLSGTITTVLSPNTGPFSELHITDLDATNTEDVTLTFTFIPIIGPTVRIGLGPGMMRVQMENPGPRKERMNHKTA